MDRTSKTIVNYLKTCPHNQLFYFDEPYKKLGLDEDEFFRCVRYLKSIDFLETITNQHGTSLGIQLTHQGVHSTYFFLERIKAYWTEKWIDMLALIVSIISLLISFAALILSLVS